MRTVSTKRMPTAVQCGCYRLRALCWALLGALAGPAAPVASTPASIRAGGATGTTGEERR